VDFVGWHREFGGLHCNDSKVFECTRVSTDTRHGSYQKHLLELDDSSCN